MEEHERYLAYRDFLGSPLWIQELKPALIEWLEGKRKAVLGSTDPQKCWEAKKAADAAEEVVPLIERTADEIRKKLERLDRESKRGPVAV